MKTKKKPAPKHRDTVTTLRRDLAAEVRAREGALQAIAALRAAFASMTAAPKRDEETQLAVEQCERLREALADACPSAPELGMKESINDGRLRKIVEERGAARDEVIRLNGDLADAKLYQKHFGHPNDADIKHLVRAGEDFKDALRRVAGERDQARQACEIWSGRLAEAERALKKERAGHAITAKARVAAEAAPKAVRVRLNHFARQNFKTLASREGSIVGLDRSGLHVLFDGLSVARYFQAHDLEEVQPAPPQAPKPADIRPAFKLGDRVFHMLSGNTGTVASIDLRKKCTVPYRIDLDGYSGVVWCAASILRLLPPEQAGFDRCRSKFPFVVRDSLDAFDFALGGRIGERHPEGLIPLPPKVEIQMERGPTIAIRTVTSRSFFAFDPRTFTVTLERRTS